MSGICAVWRKDDPRRTPLTLERVSAGLVLDPSERVAVKTGDAAGVAVAARFGTQQVFASGELLVACDADLTNAEDLRRDVPDAAAAAGSETASLLARLYDRFGTGLAERLRGNFSFVIWDRQRRRMVAGADNFGVNRLAWYEDNNVLVIASRVDAIARAGDLTLDVNPRAIANVLNFSANLAPYTIFRQVTRMQPGTLLTASESGTRVETYWDMRYDIGRERNVQRLSREMEAVVQQAVATQCTGADPETVGAFLSGGTDSSTVVGMLSRLGPGRAKAFSIGFEEQPFNELGYAQLAAKKFGAEHHIYLVSAEDCFRAIPDVVRAFDEPFGNASAVPTYFCAKLAAEHGVRVLLGGDGGDELFGGNERYATDKIFEFYQDVPRVLRKGLVEPLLQAVPFENGVFRRARGYVRRSNLPGIERLLSFHFLYTHAADEVFAPAFVEALDGYSIAEIPAHHYGNVSANQHLDRVLYVDVKITLADNDLPKVTRTSELAGVQTRYPFLDRTVAEFSGRVPAHLKVKRLQKRYLFKKAFAELLPPEIIQKKKHGFGIPVAPWLKSYPQMRELAQDTLRSARAFERGYFRRDFVEDLFRKHEQDESTYYGDTLWTLLVTELWHRQVVDRPVGVGA